MKFTKPMFTIASLLIFLPITVHAKPIDIQSGNVRIIREPNGSIQINTGNTQLSVPRQPIGRDIHNYPINDRNINRSISRPTIRNSRCGNRTVRTHQTNRVWGSNRTNRQTSVSTNICP